MFSELRLTLRALAKSPGFTAVAVLTLTLGIGINSAMFGIVNAVLLRGLPFPQQDRLHRIYSHKPADGWRMNVSHADFVDLRGEQRSFEDLAAYQTRTFNVSGPGADPERVIGTLMTPSAFTLLRVSIPLGRFFEPREEKAGAEAVAILGHDLWQKRFKADPDVLGQPIKINGEWATIVGVAPAGFRFPEISDLWMALRLKPDRPRDDRPLAVFGRLKPGVPDSSAQNDLSAIAGRLARAHQDTNKDVTVLVRQLARDMLDDETRRMVMVMFGAVGFVLLIACANVANLLLSRSAVRQKEVAVRSALGASRGVIVRLLLLESLLLSLAGAMLGLPLAHGLMALLRAHLVSQIIPYWIVFDIDATGVAYILGLSVVTCLIAGLWPAWQLSRADVNSVLKESGRGTTNFALSRFTRVLVVGEIVLSTVLLVLAGLTIRSVIRMQLAPLGYRTDGIFTARVALMGPAYEELQPQMAFQAELLRRLGERPEVTHAAVATMQPTWYDRSQVEIEGQPRGGSKGSGLPPQFAWRSAVSGSYFETLGIRLLQGRNFEDRDARGATRVAIVSSKFAERHWPRDNPLGKRFVFGWGLNVGPDDWITVIGTAAPVLQGSYQAEMIDLPQVYLPYTQEGDVRYLNVFAQARPGGDPAALAKVVRDTVRTIDADQPIYWARTLEDQVRDARFYKELFAWIFSLFGFVALLLATVGLYGVMSYSVSQRTQEIGVRMALGAEPSRVVGMVLREGGLRLGLGLALGLVLGLYSGNLIASVLFGVEPRDLPVFAATVFTLGLAGLLACLIPAQRAVHVNPVEALRCE